VVACVALLPERIVGAGVVAGVTDMGWPDAWEGYDPLEATLMRIGDEAAAVKWCEEHYEARNWSGPFDSSWANLVHALMPLDSGLRSTRSARSLVACFAPGRAANW
jgi:hypothetical protein